MLVLVMQCLLGAFAGWCVDWARGRGGFVGALPGGHSMASLYHSNLLPALYTGWGRAGLRVAFTNCIHEGSQAKQWVDGYWITQRQWVI